MIINLGDTIREKNGREGVITNIGIATEKTDIAAESDNSLNAKTYDTELNYTGAITFGEYWCYFDQIDEVIKQMSLFRYIMDERRSDIDIALI